MKRGYEITAAVVGLARHVCSNEDGRYALTCLLFRGTDNAAKVFATNGRILAWAVLPFCEGSVRELLVPRNILLSLPDRGYRVHHWAWVCTDEAGNPCIEWAWAGETHLITWRPCEFRYPGVDELIGDLEKKAGDEKGCYAWLAAKQLGKITSLATTCHPDPTIRLDFHGGDRAVDFAVRGEEGELVRGIVMPVKAPSEE